MHRAVDVNHCLLLDLDGVVVFETGPPLLPDLEILVLQEDIIHSIASLDAAVVILTHRSRAEANGILKAAGIAPAKFAGVMAAEDLAISAARHRQLGRMLRKGLRKSLILPEVERRFGVPRHRTALIDDRVDNVQDMVARGLGLALHVPSEVAPDGETILTYDLASTLEIFRDWTKGAPTPRVVTLPETRRAVMSLRRTGLNTRREGRHAFNAARSLGNIYRRISWRD
jgi:hypothetical protein